MNGSTASGPDASAGGRDAAGRTARRRSATTPAPIATSYDRRFGPFPADDIGELEWQMWCDRLSREGLSRSRISSLVAVASAIYAWAITPTRRHASRNPLRLIELPPNDEKPRLRVACAPEAEKLLNTLEPEDALPYAIAFYAGLRRSEIHRLEWPDVLAGRKIASRLLVARAKSDAGTERRPRSPTRSATSSVEPGCAKADRRPAR
jgi:integrase